VYHAPKKIDFTDTFFDFLVAQHISVADALAATIDLRYHSHTNRCEKVRGQGNSPLECCIPPR
jgi:hypothetical protein